MLPLVRWRAQRVVWLVISVVSGIVVAPLAAPGFRIS